MRVHNVVVFAAAIIAPAAISAQQTVIDGSESAIRVVVSGKTCTGDDVIKFGEIATGAAGTFERAGHPRGAYSVGYGTILIDRDGNMHGHLTSVSVADRMLFMSASRYQCR